MVCLSIYLPVYSPLALSISFGVYLPSLPLSLSASACICLSDYLCLCVCVSLNDSMSSTLGERLVVLQVHFTP